MQAFGNLGMIFAILTLLSMESWGLRTKKYQTSVAVPPAPVRVPSQRTLPRVSRQSRRSLMIRVIMK